MRNKISRDNQNRHFYLKNQYNFILYKYIIYNRTLPITSLNKKQQSLFFLLKFKNKLIKPKNYCILSHRSKGVYKKFRLSRFFLKEGLDSGLLFGLKPASW